MTPRALRRTTAGVATAIGLAALGTFLGAWLIPVAFLYLVFGGG